MTAPVQLGNEHRAAWMAGRVAYVNRVPVTDNPYSTPNPDKRQRTLIRLWLAGWERDRPDPPTPEQVAQLEAGTDSPV